VLARELPDISQGSVATLLRYTGIFTAEFWRWKNFEWRPAFDKILDENVMVTCIDKLDDGAGFWHCSIQYITS